MKPPPYLLAIRLAILLGGLAAFAGSARAQLAISDEGVEFRVGGTSDFSGTGGAWTCDFLSDAATVDQLFQIGWAIRFAGQTSQSRLNIPDSASAVGDTLTLGYDDVGGRGVASAEIVLVVDGADSGARGTLLATLRLTNLRASANALDLVFYADPDIQPDAADDLASSGGTFGDSILLADAGARTLELRGVDFDAFEVRSSSTLRAAALSNVVSFEAAGTGLPAGPADVRCAMQWKRTLPPNGSLSFEVGFGLNVPAVPVTVSGYAFD